MTPEHTTKDISIRTKAELAIYIEASASTLRYLLNVKYYEELKELGYQKHKSILPPIVIRRFIEIWGKKLDDHEL